MILEFALASIAWVAGCIILRPALIKMAAYERRERRRLEHILVEAEKASFERLLHERTRREALETVYMRLRQAKGVDEIKSRLSELEHTLLTGKLSDT